MNKKTFIKKYFLLWIGSLLFLAGLCLYSSDSWIYHIPVKPIYLLPETVYSPQKYDSQISSPYVFSDGKNLEKKNRLETIKFNFITAEPLQDSVILQAGGDSNGFKLFLSQSNLYISIFQDDRSLSQTLELKKLISANELYQIKIYLKTHHFLHISINNQNILDIDAQIKFDSSNTYVGSDSSQKNLFTGSIDRIKIIEGNKEIKISHSFRNLFIIVLLAFPFFLIYPYQLSNQLLNGIRQKLIDLWPTRRTIFLASFISIFFGFIYYVWYLTTYRYLPSPFVYPKSVVFNDFFAPLYWAFNEGRYTEWGSVYPPLVFWFLKLFEFFLPSTALADGLTLRDNSPIVIFILIGMYLIAPIIVMSSSSWRSLAKYEKLLTYLMVILSAPLLFSLERGNIIFLCPIFMAFMMSSSRYLQALNLAILINIKPYFLILSGVYVFSKNFYLLAVAILFTGGIFLVTGLLLDPNFYYLPLNLMGFGNAKLTGIEVIALPTSLSALSYFIKSPDNDLFPLNIFSLSTLESAYLIELTKWTAVFISCLMIFKSKSNISEEKAFIFLTLLVTNIGIFVGGYAVVLYYPFIPVMLQMRYRAIYIALLVGIAMPLDIVTLFEHWFINSPSYFSLSQVDVRWTIGLGSILRPIFNILLLLIISIEVSGRSIHMDRFRGILSAKTN